MSSAFGIATDLLNDLRQVTERAALEICSCKVGTRSFIPLSHHRGLNYPVFEKRRCLASVCTSGASERYLLLEGSWCLQLPRILGSGVSSLAPK